MRKHRIGLVAIAMTLLAACGSSGSKDGSATTAAAATAATSAAGTPTAASVTTAGGASPSTAAGSTNASAPAATGPDKLTVAIPQEPVTLDHPKQSDNVKDLVVWRINEPLVDLDTSSQLVPVLATEMPTQDPNDPTKWTVKLREG